jgi:hypothetical protein
MSNPHIRRLLVVMAFIVAVLWVVLAVAGLSCAGLPPASTMVNPVLDVYADGGALGTLYFLSPGTTWPTGAKSVYSNMGATSALPNPVSINSSGQPTTAGGAITQIYGTGAYKVILVANGGSINTPIWTMDNVVFHGDSWGPTAMGYGAAGNGVTDDTANLVAANSNAAALGSALTISAGTYVISSSSITFTVPVIVQPGAVFSPTSGKSITFNSTFQGALGCFSPCTPGQVVFSWEAARNGIDPEWWTINTSPGTTDMTTALKAAMGSFTSAGGVMLWNGLYAWGSPLIWPNASGQCFPITIKGLNGSPGNGGTTPSMGYYTGVTSSTGSIDCMNGFGTGGQANLIWTGAIQGVTFWGPGSNPSTTTTPTASTPHGIIIYQMGGSLDNTEFICFGYGLYVRGPGYYSNMRRSNFLYNYVGFYAYSSNFNGSKPIACKFSHNMTFGVQSSYSGSPGGLDGCWLEQNGSSAISLSSPGQFTLIGCDLDTNGADGNAEIVVSSNGQYNAVITLIEVNTAPATTHNSVTFTGPGTLVAQGCSLQAYNTSNAYVMSVAGGVAGALIGNKWPQAAGLTPVPSVHMSNFFIQDSIYPNVTLGSIDNYATNVTAGSIIINTSGTGPVGWQCTVPGAGTQATALSITGTTVATQYNITSLSALTGLSVGCPVKVAGVTWGAGAAAYTTIVGFASNGTTAYTAAYANQSVTTQNLSYNAVVYEPWPNDGVYTNTSGTGWTINLQNGNVQDLTLTATGQTITLPSAVAGLHYTLRIHYSGAYSFTWAGGGTIKWPAGSAPTQTSTNGKVDIFRFESDGTNTYGYANLNF